MTDPKTLPERAIERIKRHRFDRGRDAALSGEPPSEGNAEYAEGYAEGLKSRGRPS